MCNHPSPASVSFDASAGSERPESIKKDLSKPTKPRGPKPKDRQPAAPNVGYSMVGFPSLHPVNPAAATGDIISIASCLPTLIPNSLKRKAVDKEIRVELLQRPKTNVVKETQARFRQQFEQDGKFACDGCSQKCSTYANLQRHRQNKHGKKVKCELEGCGKVCAGTQGLAEHWDEVHPDRCRPCNSKFVSADAKTRHDNGVHRIVDENIAEVPEYHCHQIGCFHSTKQKSALRRHELCTHPEILDVDSEKASMSCCAGCLLLPLVDSDAGKYRSNIGSACFQHKSYCKHKAKVGGETLDRLHEMSRRDAMKMDDQDLETFAAASKDARANASKRDKDNVYPAQDSLPSHLALSDNDLVEFIDNLVDDNLGIGLGMDDLAIRHGLHHRDDSERTVRSTEALVSSLIDRYIPTIRANVRYHWWLHRTKKYKKLSDTELEEFITQQNASLLRKTHTTATYDGIDFSVVSVGERIVGHQWGASAEAVRALLISEDVNRAWQTPIGHAMRLFWTQHSGKRNFINGGDGGDKEVQAELRRIYLSAVKAMLGGITDGAISGQGLEIVQQFKAKGVFVDDLLDKPATQQKTSILDQVHAELIKRNPGVPIKRKTLISTIKMRVGWLKADRRRNDRDAEGQANSVKGNRFTASMAKHFAFALNELNLSVSIIEDLDSKERAKNVQRLLSTRYGARFLDSRRLWRQLVAHAKVIDSTVQKFSLDPAFLEDARKIEVASLFGIPTDAQDDEEAAEEFLGDAEASDDDDSEQEPMVTQRPRSRSDRKKNESTDVDEEEAEESLDDDDEDDAEEYVGDTGKSGEEDSELAPISTKALRIRSNSKKYADDDEDGEPSEGED